MELIQASQVSLLPQEALTAAWSNNSLLLSTPTEPPLDYTRSDASLLLNGTCQNCTAPEHGPLPGLTGIFIPLIYGIVCVVGLVGNTLVIHVIVNYTKNESVTNIYILNLAIADELFMLGLPFLAVQNALLSWPFGSLMCRVVMTVDAINQFTSIFCLTVMSVDRYLAVVHPIRSFWWRRPRVAKAISGTVWAGSFVVVLPVVVFADVLKDDGNCSIVWPEPAEVWKTSFIVYTCTVGFFCPLLVICLCYLLIVFKVQHLQPHRCVLLRQRCEVFACFLKNVLGIADSLTTVSPDVFINELSIFHQSSSSLGLIIPPGEFHVHLSRRSAPTVSLVTSSTGKINWTFTSKTSRK